MTDWRSTASIILDLRQPDYVTITAHVIIKLYNPFCMEGFYDAYSGAHLRYCSY